jgi:hypothetical protein
MTRFGHYVGVAVATRGHELFVGTDIPGVNELIALIALGSGEYAK